MSIKTKLCISGIAFLIMLAGASLLEAGCDFKTCVFIELASVCVMILCGRD